VRPPDWAGRPTLLLEFYGGRCTFPFGSRGHRFPQHGQTTRFRNPPSPSISTSITSRFQEYRRIPAPTPSGAPVAMMSPGSSVIAAEINAISTGILKIRFEVLEFCTSAPLTLMRIARACGSGTASRASSARARWDKTYRTTFPEPCRSSKLDRATVKLFGTSNTSRVSRKSEFHRKSQPTGNDAGSLPSRRRHRTSVCWTKLICPHTNQLVSLRTAPPE
jgi:hypothetical protein